MEIDFDRIDINQCPIGEGNPPPNYFAGTARCKNETTQCEPIHGFGFRRGGYQCRCKPGYRLPKIVRTPYLGELVERATEMEHERGFHCERIGYIAVRTQNVVPIDKIEREKLISRVETLTGLYGKRREKFSSNRLDPSWVTDYIRKNVTAQTCGYFERTLPDALVLRGDIAYGKEEQLENQARMAVRLANFISSFLQVVDPKEQFAEFRVPDKPLTQDQIIGEALASVIGDRNVLGCGVLFDRQQFAHNITYFAPYAYRLDRNTRKFFVDDMARVHPHEKKFYLKIFSFVILIISLTSIECKNYVHHPVHYQQLLDHDSYNFGYDTGLDGSHQFHQEFKDHSGVVRGRYGYTDPFGKY